MNALRAFDGDVRPAASCGYGPHLVWLERGKRPRPVSRTIVRSAPSISISMVDALYRLAGTGASPYKMGELEKIRGSLRAEAKPALGEQFDIRAFHDAVLEEGAVRSMYSRRISRPGCRAKRPCSAARSMKLTTRRTASFRSLSGAFMELSRACFRALVRAIPIRPWISKPISVIQGETLPIRPRWRPS